MSEVKTDKLTGVSTAKTVNVTVGATATQSLEQGLAKAFHGYGDQSAGDLNADLKTLNISSYVDHAAGRSRLNVTSAFDVSNGQAVITATQAYDYGSVMVSTTQYEAASVNSSGNYADGVTHAVLHGDLA